MTCTTEQRATARNAADALRERDTVVAVDVLAPHDAPHGRWTVDVVCDGDGIPPAVLDDLSHYGLTLRGCHPQGPYWQCAGVL